MKPITTTVGGRVTIPEREVLEKQAATKGMKLSTFISRMLKSAARRYAK